LGSHRLRRVAGGNDALAGLDGECWFCVDAGGLLPLLVLAFVRWRAGSQVVYHVAACWAHGGLGIGGHSLGEAATRRKRGRRAPVGLSDRRDSPECELAVAWHVEDARVHKGGVAYAGPPQVSVSSLLESQFLQ
jgi:hypothetical protein